MFPGQQQYVALRVLLKSASNSTYLGKSVLFDTDLLLIFEYLHTVLLG